MLQHNLTEDMRRCLALCREGHDVCLRAVTHCLERGGRHTEPSHIRLLLDCSQICATSADFLARGSNLHTATCAACAEVCERCAEDCERLGDDEAMRYCAQICRRCAESCHHMAGVHAAAGAAMR